MLSIPDAALYEVGIMARGMHGKIAECECGGSLSMSEIHRA